MKFSKLMTGSLIMISMTVVFGCAPHDDDEIKPSTPPATLGDVESSVDAIEALGCEIVRPVESDPTTSQRPSSFDCKKLKVTGKETATVFVQAFDAYIANAKSVLDAAQTRPLSAQAKQDVSDLLFSAQLNKAEVLDVANQIRIENEAKLKCEDKKQ